MSNQADEIERLLAELRALLAQSRTTAEPAPLLLKFPEAAKYLGVGLTKLKSMVRSGALLTSDIDGARMISRAELERIAEPKQLETKRVAPRRSGKPNQNLDDLKARIAARRKSSRH